MDLIHNSLRGTFNWFKSKFGFEAIEQGSTPSTPSASIRRLYPKSDGWYDLDDAGTETKIGAGGTGSGLPDDFEATAGEALSQYVVVYQNAADSGEMWIASNDGTADEADAVAIVVESGGISDGATGTLTRLGLVTNGSWSLNPGPVYLGVDGAIAQEIPTAGNYAKPLGWAVTATSIFFFPTNGWLVGFDVELSEVPAINDGRIELVSSSQIKWDGYRVSLWDSDKGRDVECIPSSTPVLNYNSNDVDSNALVAAYPYDLFLEYVSATSCSLVAKKWTNATTRAVTPALWHGRERYDNTTDTGKKRLWVGTVYLDTGPIFADSKGKRYISNKYNTKSVEIGVDNWYTSGTTDVPASDSWEGWVSSSTAWLCGVVVCEARFIGINASAMLYSNNNAVARIGIAVDGTTNSAKRIGVLRSGEPTYVVANIVTSRLETTLSAGYHTLLPVQAQVTGTTAGTIYFWETTYSALGKVACFDGNILA